MNCCWRWRPRSRGRRKSWSTSIENTRMSTSAAPIRDPLAAVAEDGRLLYFRTALKDFEMNVSTKAELFAQFREWLHEELTDEVLLRSYQRLYNPSYLNLLSVL